MTGGERRRVDWRLILVEQPPAPQAVPQRSGDSLATLLAELGEAATAETVHRVLRGAVELAREGFGLERAAIFIVDEANRAMLGTWGTDSRRATVDERHIMYDLGDSDRRVFAEAERGVPWVLFENCPIVDQLESETRVLGQGWVACTAIRGPGGPIGILFNDAASTGTPVDPSKQARVVVLCSLLGAALDGHRAAVTAAVGAAPSGGPVRARHPTVARALKRLAEDPSLDVEALSEALSLSSGRLTRLVKAETGVSIVEHRNQLRLARFLSQVDPHATNLLESALAAGFGSYAQFHRVFRERFGESPRDWLAHR